MKIANILVFSLILILLSPVAFASVIIQLQTLILMKIQIIKILAKT